MSLISDNEVVSTTTPTTTTTTTQTTPPSEDLRPVYSIADLGLRAPPQIQHTIIGPTRSMYSLSRYEWLYLFLSLTSLIALMGLTIERLIDLRSADPDFTFAFLLFWTTIFCFVYLIQGVFRERAFELMAFVFTVFTVLLYVIINYSANESHPTLKIVRLVITCLFAPLVIAIGLWLSQNYFKSKNLIFRTVGANARMQKMCELLFLASALMKFDAQLAGSALILWLRKGFRHWSEIDKIVVSVGTVITISWISLGFSAMRFENRPAIYFFFLISTFEPTIIIWNLVRYSSGPDDKVLEISFFISGIIGLIVRICTVVVMTFVMFNFNKGLKQKVYGTEEDETTHSTTTHPIIET